MQSCVRSRTSIERQRFKTVKLLSKATTFVLACPYLEVDLLPVLTSKSAQGYQ
jgi:hypothetical protein